MKIQNIDNAKYSEKHGSYGGASGLKDGLTLNNENWLVKYPKSAKNLKQHEEMSYTNDPVSEYLGSHIYHLLGYPVHETMLVERHGKIAVACKDFLNEPMERLLEVRTIKNSANQQLAELLDRSFSSTGSQHVIDLEEIIIHLNHNELLYSVDGLKERFFDMIVIDAFINNADRNNGNWGIIRAYGKPDKLAPVYDNGGAMNGKTPDSRLERILSVENGIYNSIINGKSIFGKDGESFYTRTLLKTPIDELQNALIKNVPLIKKQYSAICELIDEIPDNACSQIRKEFYKKSLEARITYILEPALEMSLQVKGIHQGSKEGQDQDEGQDLGQDEDVTDLDDFDITD